MLTRDDEQEEPKLLAGFAAQCVRDCELLARFAPSGVHALASFAHHRATVVDVACKETSASSGCYSGEERARQSVALKFGDFVDFYCASHAGTDHWLKDVDDLEFYLCQCPIAVFRPDATCASAALPQIMDDFIVPEELPFRASDLSQVNLWIAVCASRTSLHYDAYANVLVVLHGRKTVTLYAPSESGNVYAHPVHAASANHSRVDVSDPTAVETAHPRFAQARAQRFVVNAGDALVIPEGWWHQVDTDAFTIAINYWFDGLQKQLAQVPATVAPYCARVLLQELLKRESARYLASRCAQVVGPKSVSTNQTTQLQRSPGECRESDVDHAVQSVVVALSQNDREQALFWIAGASDDDAFRTVQQRLATEYPLSWCELLSSASDDLVALLTDCWERNVDAASKTNDADSTDASPAQEQQSQTQFMETLFSVFPDSGEHVRTQLMAKKSAFASKICARVMLDTFGVSAW